MTGPASQTRKPGSNQLKACLCFFDHYFICMRTVGGRRSFRKAKYLARGCELRVRPFQLFIPFYNHFPQIQPITIILTIMWNNNVTSTRNADSAGAAFNGEYVTTLIVPTKGAASTADEAPKTKRVIDTTNLSEEDLQALRKEDPFLYYSIPTIRHHSVLRIRSSAADTDVTTQRSRNQESACSRRASCPSRVEVEVESSSSGMVERKSCISVECHTDLVLEDFMDDTELFGNGDGVDLDTETLFDQDQVFLRHCHKGHTSLLSRD